MTLSFETMEAQKKHHDLESPGEYWQGRVVSKLDNGRRFYGHIRSFYRTLMGEFGVEVRWEDGQISAIHHNNIDLH